jgi:hypothetical protein
MSCKHQTANAFIYVIKNIDGVQICSESEIKVILDKLSSDDSLSPISYLQDAEFYENGDDQVFIYVEKGSMLSLATSSNILLQKHFPEGVDHVTCTAAELLVLTASGKHMYGFSWTGLGRAVVNSNPKQVDTSAFAGSSNNCQDLQAAMMQTHGIVDQTQLNLKMENHRSECSLLYGPPSESLSGTSSLNPANPYILLDEQQHKHATPGVIPSMPTTFRECCRHVSQHRYDLWDFIAKNPCLRGH